MIAFLQGTVADSGVDSVVLDVHGVGYRVLCSAKTLASLPPQGQACRLWTDMHIREDAHILYGFTSNAEQHWFRLLNSVQGVGGKAALAVLSHLTPEQVERALAAQDSAAFRAADGVGPKLAQRIVAELKDKAALRLVAPGAKGAPAGSGGITPQADPAADAVAALVNLGYARLQAFTAVQQALDNGAANDDAGGLITAALRRLAMG
ncbi:MAG: Holliday junction branch migration protein RuvA [Holosporales bacterium]|jgi:Holliday junction DNA helicase RuvA